MRGREFCPAPNAGINAPTKEEYKVNAARIRWAFKLREGKNAATVKDVKKKMKAIVSRTDVTDHLLLTTNIGENYGHPYKLSDDALFMLNKIAKSLPGLWIGTFLPDEQPLDAVRSRAGKSEAFNALPDAVKKTKPRDKLHCPRFQEYNKDLQTKMESEESTTVADVVPYLKSLLVLQAHRDAVPDKLESWT